MKRRRFLPAALSFAAVAGEPPAGASPMNNHYYFSGGAAGPWRVTRSEAYRGKGLEPVERLSISQAPPAREAGIRWTLRGFTSNVRYATAEEVRALRAKQEPLGRPGATCAALIPIRKSRRWWDLAQDERRRIFEETSHHTAIGLEYLPAIARRLHHCRDLGGEFDFLTWFEFPPSHRAAFEELVARLRATREWEYVEREFDLRLERDR